MAKKPNASKYGPPAYAKAKPATPTKPVPIVKSRPAYAKAKPVTPTKPVAIVNSAEERARRVTQSGLSALGPLPGKKAAPSSKPPQPTAAERAAAQRQNASLKKAKVSAAEARTIASANRSEASSKKPQVTRTTVNYRPTPSKPATKPSTAKKYPNFEF